MPYMFSGTSFSTGGYSAEYGQALSSVLILNSKFVATQERTDLSLMSVGGDISTTQVWDAASLSGKVQYTNLDPYMSLIDQEIDWIDGPTSLEGSAAYRQKTSSSGILKIFGNFNRSNFTLFHPDISNPDLKTRVHNRNRYAYLNAMLEEVTSNNWNIKGGVSYTWNRGDIGLNEAKVREDEKGLHAKMVLSKEIGLNANLKIGSDFFNRQFYQNYDQPVDHFSNRAQFIENLVGVFAESDIFISKSILARVGLRSEYIGLTQNIHLAPRISLAFKTSEDSQVSAAFGHFHQTPQNQWLLIAPQLQQERATHYILNYQINKKGRTFRIEGYHKFYNDLVKFKSNNPQIPVDFSNNGSGYARGFDIFWRDNRSLPNVDYWISYSFLDTKRDHRDFPVAASPQFASRHNLSIVYKHFISKIKSQIGLTASYVSGRPYHNPNEKPFMNSRSPDYLDVSANLSYLMRQNIIVHLSATNLLGRDHIFGYEYADTPDAQGIFAGRAIGPAARRFLFLGVFITFSKDEVLNQLPSL